MTTHIAVLIGVIVALILIVAAVVGLISWISKKGGRKHDRSPEVTLDAR